jgi:hypothetical protein
MIFCVQNLLILIRNIKELQNKFLLRLQTKKLFFKILHHKNNFYVKNKPH